MSILLEVAALRGVMTATVANSAIKHNVFTGIARLVLLTRRR